jgi:hypothetical protein
MHRLRFAILGAAAALTLGTATAVAMQQSTGGGTDPDQHGDNVASAARTCPHGPGGVHGQCVSAVASSKSDATEKDTPKATNNPTTACKAADATEDASEKQPAKGDKAAKAADQKEDKSEHQAFATCVSGSSTETEDATDAADAADAPDKNEADAADKSDR